MLHLRDRHTKWFGVLTSKLGNSDREKGGNDHSCMALQTTRRLQDLLEPAVIEAGGASIHPSIVSFVGETGAGKSTLIKALIEVSDENLNPHLFF